MKTLLNTEKKQVTTSDLAGQMRLARSETARQQQALDPGSV